MSREIFLSERFRTIVREYPKPVRSEIGQAIDRLHAALGQPHQHAGLGIRKLVKNYFEMRVGLELRLVFRIEPATVTFTFAGNQQRPHQGLGNVIPFGWDSPADPALPHTVCCEPSLGGLLKHDYGEKSAA